MDYLVLSALVLAGSLSGSALSFIASLLKTKDVQSDISDALLSRYDRMKSEDDALPA